MDLVDRFHEQVRISPDAVALVGPRERLSYRDLDGRANLLAHRLRDHGVGPEVVVGLHLNRGCGAIIGLLAILKAGGVYLPLDPVHPPQRLAYLVEAAGARLVLGEPGRTDFAVPVIDVPVTGGQALAPPTRPTGPDNLMCVIFTSGSTGLPKGIGLCSRSIENVADWPLGRSPGPRVCAQFCSLGFDMSLQEIFGTFLGGGRLVVVDEERRTDPYLLLDLLAEEQVERIYLSPGFLRQLAGAYLVRTERPRLRLREVIAAGEPLRVTPDIRDFFAELGEAELENQYGPSETHQATANPLPGDPARWPVNPALGQAIPNVSLYLLDAALRPVPQGEAGEIYIGGRGVARGYVGRPAQTAERFVADPFAAGPGRLMYRTGDRGRWADGGLEFLGRLDNQVKIRGFRVEPSEVEAAIVAHPDVREVAVVPHQEADGMWRLDAYLVAAHGASAPGTVALRTFLGDRLPEYMIPATARTLNSLPLNRNGKVDRAALPSADNGRRAGGPYVPPENDQEVVLCELIAEVLGVQQVGIDDDFLELGGNSLHAARVIARVADRFDVRLPVRTVFDQPTVRRLAGEVERVVLAEIQALSPAEARAAMAPGEDR